MQSAGLKPKKDAMPHQLSAAQAVRTLRFYLLWLMFFLNITCGIAVISVASPMAQELAQMTPLAAAAMVGVLGVFNGLGRIGWSALSDHIGRPALWMLFFVLQCAAFVLLPRVTNGLLFQGLVFLIVSCYGGGFASMPAFLSDVFGTRQLSAILGYLLTAWSAAGIAGPIFVAWIRQNTGSYEKTFLVFSAMFAAALAVSILLWIDTRRLATLRLTIHAEETPAA
jgi:OFA family oxalate/formate antiporter-like MFS transporter